MTPPGRAPDPRVSPLCHDSWTRLATFVAARHMQTTSTDSLEQPEPQSVAAPSQDASPIASTAALGERELELLALNMDAALRVHTRPQFFSWTQGALQSVIRHELLVCALRSGDAGSFRVDSFSTAL